MKVLLVYQKIVIVPAALALGQFACNFGAQTPGGGGASAPATPTTAPAPQAGEISICSLLTADEVTSILGSPAEGHSRSGGEAGRRFVNCEYYASTTNTLTVQGGNADQAKELIMAGMYSILSQKPDPAKQQLVDQVKAQMATLSAHEMFEQLTSVYEWGGYAITSPGGVGDTGAWMWHADLRIAIAEGSKGGQEFIDLIWAFAPDEQTAKDKLVPVANAVLERMPAGAKTVP